MLFGGTRWCKLVEALRCDSRWCHWNF